MSAHSTLFSFNIEYFQLGNKYLENNTDEGFEKEFSYTGGIKDVSQ